MVQSNEVQLAQLGIQLLIKAHEDASVGRTPTGLIPPSDSPRVPSENAFWDAEDEKSPEDIIQEAIDILEQGLNSGDLPYIDRVEIEKALPILKWGVSGGDIPLSVKAVIKDDKGRVLVLRDEGTDFWDLPGGHLMEGEVLEDALRREVREETGLRIAECTQTDTRLLELGGQLRPVLFYNVNCSSTPVLLSEEHCGFQWADEIELSRLNLGAFKDFLVPQPEVVEDMRNMQLKEDGGDGIASVGTPTVSSEVFTEVGGSGRKRLKSLTSDSDFYKFTKYLQESANSVANQKGKPLNMVKSKTPAQGYLNRFQILNKANDDRFIIAGYASPVVVDQEGHRISHDALREGLPNFMALNGAYANVNVMHSNLTVGRVLPSYVASDGTKYETKVDEIGLYCVAEVRTDPHAPPVVKQVIEDIKKGELRSFSISGNADNPVFMCDDKQCFYDIGKVDFYEITLCSQGVNQDAKFDIVNA